MKDKIVFKFLKISLAIELQFHFKVLFILKKTNIFLNETESL